MRVNNFIGSAGVKQRVANSHSPSGLAAGSSKDSNLSSQIRPKLKKGIKIVSNPGKSPYLNGHFSNKMA